MPVGPFRHQPPAGKAAEFPGAEIEITPDVWQDIDSLAFAADSRSLMTSSIGEVSIYRAPSWRADATLADDPDDTADPRPGDEGTGLLALSRMASWYSGISLLKDGRTALVADSSKGKVIVLSLPSGRRIEVVHPGYIGRALFLPKLGVLAAIGSKKDGSAGARVRIWRVVGP